MKTVTRLILCAAALFAAVAFISTPEDSEAGLFRNRFGEPRQPIRNAIRAVAANRQARLGGGCSGDSASYVAACNSLACNDAACDQVAAAAFSASVAESQSQQADSADAANTLPPLAAIRPSDSVRLSPPPQARVIQLPGLGDRERRLTFLQSFVWNKVKASPVLRKAVARYAEARGYGAIDPNNLAALLDVFLAFFEKLLPLILQLVQADPTANGLTWVVHIPLRC